MQSPRYSSNGGPLPDFSSLQNRLRGARVAIATSHGLHYYRFARSLRALGIRFDSILPARAPFYDGDLLFSTRAEVSAGVHVPVLDEDASEAHPFVLCALMLQKITRRAVGDELVLGVDPGSRTGLSVFYLGYEIGASFYTSVDELVDHMIGIMASLRAQKKIVRIGRGNMDVAAQICDLLNLRFCSSFELEIVNEHGTSPRTRNLNSRGRRDMLSARSIAQRSGSRQMILPHSISS